VKLLLDEYAHLDSPLHRWEPRCRLIGLMALILGFSFVRDLRLLPAMIAASFALYAVSRLPVWPSCYLSSPARPSSSASDRSPYGRKAVWNCS